MATHPFTETRVFRLSAGYRAGRRVGVACAAGGQLRQGGGADRGPGPGRGGRGHDPRRRRPGPAGADSAVRGEMARGPRRRARHAESPRGGDQERKSVVKGRGVAELVDLGGRRTITKKTTESEEYQTRHGKK